MVGEDSLAQIRSLADSQALRNAPREVGYVAADLPLRRLVLNRPRGVQSIDLLFVPPAQMTKEAHVSFQLFNLIRETGLKAVVR
jgi:hypothetical protein